jgi:hypothetical protein
MLALFLLFPRIPPLWSMPGDGARTGLSDHLRLGDVAELAQDDSVALRLRFEGPPRRWPSSICADRCSPATTARAGRPSPGPGARPIT